MATAKPLFKLTIDFKEEVKKTESLQKLVIHSGTLLIDETLKMVYVEVFSEELTYKYSYIYPLEFIKFIKKEYADNDKGSNP